MEEQKVIHLNSNPKSVIKVGLLVRAIYFLMPAIIFFFIAVIALKEELLGAIVCFIIGILFFYIFFKILNRAFFKEFLTVTKQDVTLTLKTLSNKKEYVFLLNEIKYFGFSSQTYTKHPLDNPIVDFTGLAATERELQFIIDEGNIKIETATQSIKCGKDLPSWEVEEIINDIEQFTECKFNKPLNESNYFNSSVITELDPELESETEVESIKNDNNELEAESIADSKDESEVTSSTTFFEKYKYNGDFGELILEQKNEVPSIEDKAFLNGKPAPTGKYQIGDKLVVLVSNGIIYAVRQ